MLTLIDSMAITRKSKVNLAYVMYSLLRASIKRVSSMIEPTKTVHCLTVSQTIVESKRMI